MNRIVRLRTLELTGREVPPAVLELAPGLNAIIGPSDTGKTFIAQCVSFALGASTPPKEIPEARGYDSVRLEIVPDGEQSLWLSRPIRGGDATLTRNSEKETRLSTRKGKTYSVSDALLDLLDLRGARIRTDASGSTRELSFRDLFHFAIIGEEEIISAGSPVMTGQYTAATAEKSIFRLLLTGEDDSGVTRRDDPKTIRTKNAGKIEVLQELLSATASELGGFAAVLPLDDLDRHYRGIDIAYEAAVAELQAHQMSVAELEDRRRESWRALKRTDSEMQVANELHVRFLLLREQYKSDLQRLEAISEAGHWLGHLGEERCPVCGAQAAHHDFEHVSAASSPASVAQACLAEAAKIRSLVGDLEETIEGNEALMVELERQRNEQHALMQDAAAQLRQLLQPRLSAAAQRLREVEEVRGQVLQAFRLQARQEELQTMLHAASLPVKRTKSDRFTELPPAEVLTALAQKTEELLHEWRVPNVGRVNFSEASFDIMIDGRARSSHGKGVRAITRAAFNIALMLTAMEFGRHPGFVLLDSPLVVYREPDPGEGAFPAGVKAAFYESLAQLTNAQVIVLENDGPPGSIQPNANVVTFTGSHLGRWGFVAG